MGSFLDTEISGVLINSVASEEMLKEIEDAGLLEPNKIYITPDEDENVSYLRVETLYDMTGKSASNWGYNNGIANNVNVTGKDFSKYDKLMFYCARLDANSDANSCVVTVDLSSLHYNGYYAGSAVSMLNASSVMFGDCVRIYVGATKTDFTAYMTEYTSGPNNYVTENLKINKIEGVLKEPAMIYTGEELHEGNGIKIDNGVVSSDGGYLMLSVPFASSTIHTIQTELTEGTYDIFITGNASAGTDMYFYVNGDQSATYFWNSYQNYNASGSVTGGGSPWAKYFFMGSMFIYESRYHITLTITKESGVMFNSVGGGIDQNTYYTRHTIGSKASVPNRTINSITFGSLGSATTAGNVKIYKRY